MNYSGIEEKMSKTLSVLKENLSEIRAGRANPAILNKIKIEYYGVPTPINQVAGISVPEARMIVIQPWDASILKEIEKEILKSDIGINPNNDGKVIRLAFPELNEERRKEIVKDIKKMAEEGHEIASHSNTHPKVNNLSYEENVKEIESSVEKIEKITGKKTNLYRPPYGEYNNTVISSAEDKGYKSIQWNLDTLDYTGLTGEKMWKRIEKVKAGDIILSHNGTEHTADSLDMLIKNIKSKKLEVVKVSDLIYKDNYKINVNGTQIKN